MSRKQLCIPAAIAVSLLFLSACSTTREKEDTAHIPSFTNSSIAEEITPDHNIGPGNTIRNSEGKIIDPMNGEVVEE